MARRAFTLVEMLLVVAIFALLISILLPAMGKSRDLVRRTVCANNHSQVGIGFLSYAADMRAWFPANPADKTGYGPALFERDGNKQTSLVTQMKPFVGAFTYFQCPASPEAALPDHPGNTSSWNVWAFWYLGNYRNSAGVYSSKVTRARGPADWAIYSDILHTFGGWLSGPYHGNHTEFKAFTTVVQKADNPSARWHSVASTQDLAGANVLTIGGAVKFHTLEELQRVEYGSISHWYGWQK